MKDLPSRFVCSGCGATVDEEQAIPFRCPAEVEGDDVDHVLVRTLDLGRVDLASTVRNALAPSSPRSPFLSFRELFHARHLGRAHGIGDEELDGMISRLDSAVAAVDGTGFLPTPLTRCEELSRRLGFDSAGGVIVKDETGNVAGSHKARHLFGVLAYLEVRERIGWESAARSPLAIASCGNAALAAATLAKAAGRVLEVFVPGAADPATVHRLRGLGATVHVCERGAEGAGDPSVLRFREAVRGGALPFTVQGNENGLAIEGGLTLGYEIDAQWPGRSLDRLFVQVGGGALASGLMGAFREALGAGLRSALPRLHPVQTEGGHPLERAYARVTERIVARVRTEEGIRIDPDPEKRANALRDRARSALVEAELRYAVAHRREFMRPWETTPTSRAEGILDDETYDWFAVLRGMIESGGFPLVVGESAIREANDLAAATSARPVSFTGSAGLAGLLEMQASGRIGRHETVAILWTGVRHGCGG